MTSTDETPSPSAAGDGAPAGETQAHRGRTRWPLLAPAVAADVVAAVVGAVVAIALVDDEPSTGARLAGVQQACQDWMDEGAPMAGAGGLAGERERWHPLPVDRLAIAWSRCR